MCTTNSNNKKVISQGMCRSPSVHHLSYGCGCGCGCVCVCISYLAVGWPFCLSVQKLTRFIIQLCFGFGTNIQMTNTQPHLLQLFPFSSLHSSQPSKEQKIRDKMLPLLLSSLSNSLQLSFPQSLSLASCQFSRLSNDLSDRSKSSA